MSIIKGTNQIVAGFGGTKRSIGEVYFSQSSLATDNSGALPLFTGETIASANTIYPDFYNWVLSHTELQCTSAEYESALSTYGECPKYVIGGGSLRLPKLSNYIKAANTSEGITQKEAGLPNITGSYANGINVKMREDSGVFYVDSTRKSEISAPTATDGQTGSTNFDASRSNPIYGNSDTVTPPSTTLYPWVVAYTAAVPASTAQAAEFQQGLSGKADTNLGNVASNLDYVVESQVNADGSWYRKYKSGWIEQGGDSGIYTNKETKTITLLKAFENTNYIVIPININATADNYYSYQPKSLSTTSFQIRCQDSAGSSGGSVKWIAYGQGAN